MWFEARRQEKKLKNIMIDHKKRAERRRQFYERIVSSFLAFFGQKFMENFAFLRKKIRQNLCNCMERNIKFITNRRSL